jgi:hypothetical protein
MIEGSGSRRLWVRLTDPTNPGWIRNTALNLKQQAARLETRNFFSDRVVEAWNMVPGVIKRSKAVSSFKMHSEGTERRWWKTPRMA